jgi:CHAT domain-containing protein
MINRYLLVFTCLLFSSTTFSQGRLSKYFLDESVLESYSQEKEAYELYKSIHQNEGNVNRKLLRLGDLLLTMSNDEHGTAKKQMIDSAFHCAERGAAGKTRQKKLEKYYVAYAQYYRSEGLFAKALSNYYEVLGGSRDVVNPMTFATQIQVAEMLMRLNNKQGFSSLLRKLLDFSADKKSFRNSLLWEGNFLEQVLAFGKTDSLTFSQSALRFVNEEKDESNLNKQQLKITNLAAKKSAQYEMALAELQQSLHQLTRWYQAQHKYDSAVLYARRLISNSSKEDKYFSIAAYTAGKSFEILGKPDSAKRYYNLYFNGTRHELNEVYEIARFFSINETDTKTASRLFAEAIDLSKQYLRNVEDLPFNEKKEFIAAHKQYVDYVASFTWNKKASAGMLYDLMLLTKSVQLISAQRFANFLTYTSDTTSTRLYQEMKKYKEELLRSNAPEQTSALQQNIRELERRLIIRMEVLDEGGSAISWRQIQSCMSPGENVIEMVRFTNTTDGQTWYGAVIMQSSAEPRLVPVGEATSLEKRFFNFYINAIKGKLKDTVSYNHFWKPIAKNLSGKGKVYFSADGVYFKLNINTFFNGSTGAYLLNEQEVVNVLTTRHVMQSRAGDNDKLSSVYLIGSPDFGEKSSDDANGTRRSTALAYLPGAKKEINIIDSYLTGVGVNVRSHLDRSATETNLKRVDNPGILHIATHGFFYDKSQQDEDAFSQKFNTPDPMFNSGLVFSGVTSGTTDNDDGVFTAYEAMDLSLSNTEAVILSACETGLGEIQNGEGVFGLQRGFKIAGAKYIIMSLWKVDDEVTQKLMIEFYTLWFSGLSVRDAFFLAQLNVRKQYASPYYWGGFVIL